MEIEGTCNKGHKFSAHWSTWLDGKCPKCGSRKVSVWTDEMDDHKRDIYDRYRPEIERGDA